MEKQDLANLIRKLNLKSGDLILVKNRDEKVGLFCNPDDVEFDTYTPCVYVEYSKKDGMLLTSKNTVGAKLMSKMYDGVSIPSFDSHLFNAKSIYTIERLVPE